MECQRCHTELADNATYCGCGWRKLKPRFENNIRDEAVRCAHETCGIAAMCRIHTKTGWANLCWQHYDQHFEQQAVDNLDKYGLELQPDETRAEHVQRMRKFFREGFKNFAGRDAALKQALLDQQRAALIRDFSTDEGMQA